MKNSVHYRFIERDYLQAKMRSNTTYITDEQINNYLDELETDDITMIFTPTQTGFTSKLICNKTEQQITLDELNTFAWNFYLSLVEELSRKKAEYDKSQAHINKIREFLLKREEKAGFAKAN